MDASEILAIEGIGLRYEDARAELLVWPPFGPMLITTEKPKLDTPGTIDVESERLIVDKAKKLESVACKVDVELMMLVGELTLDCNKIGDGMEMKDAV